MVARGFGMGRQNRRDKHSRQKPHSTCVTPHREKSAPTSPRSPLLDHDNIEPTATRLRMDVLHATSIHDNMLVTSINHDDNDNSPNTTTTTRVSRPVLVRRMTSGTLGDNDSICLDHTIDLQHTDPDDFQDDGCSAPNMNIYVKEDNSSTTLFDKAAVVHETSYCESTGETCMETSSVSSVEESSSVHIRKLPTSSATTCCRSKLSPEATKIQEIFSTLTEQEKETAARTSWRYYCEIAQAGKTDIPRRDAITRAMIQRHLKGEGGDVILAGHKIRATLQGRFEQKLDWVRTAWDHCNAAVSSHWSQEQMEFSERIRSKMSCWLGPTGRVCILDYDDEDRCNFYHKLAIHTLGTRYDREAILYSATYMLEKAIACTERRSRGRQWRVNVVLDYRGANMRCKDQTLPISIALEVAELMKDHYPDRLWTLTMIDAPFLARFAWPLFRPFLNHIVQGGIKFVTGDKQILKAFGPKMCYFDRASNLDMDKFFQLPFDKTYEDVHGHALEY